MSVVPQIWHPKTHPSDYVVSRKGRSKGYIYIINNPAWPDWVKIGKATDPYQRVQGFNTSSPFRDYEIVYMLATNNYTTVEEKAHTLAEEIAQERRHEWFKITVQEAVDVLQSIEPNYKDRS